jgi:uncharacterized protein (TIGR00255 family)
LIVLIEIKGEKMIRSMTGYGKGESLLYDRKFTVEIKSVNHRYNEISVKLPRILNLFEERVKKQSSQVILRGKTDIYISLDTFSSADAKVNLNIPMADAYVAALRKLNDRYNLNGDIFAAATRFSELFSIDKNLAGEQAQSEIWEGLQSALSSALKQFIAMREAEGQALYTDLLSKHATLETIVKQVDSRAPYVASEHYEKLLARLTEALGGQLPDDTRLMQEITLLADKSCIDEELTRLKSHLAQLPQIMKEGGAVGRKLDFLVQEINREVNTISSKSNDLEITRLAVDLKSETEKVREQVQNIE